MMKLRVKRTNKVHDIVHVRAPVVEPGTNPSPWHETAYAIASDTPSGVTWYWQHEVELIADAP